MSNRDLNIKNSNVFSISWLVKAFVIGEMPLFTGVCGKFLEVQQQQQITTSYYDGDSGEEAEDPVGWESNETDVKISGEMPTCIIL